jgi:HAE1 family hydrophobic/amphiphilic exporter-1
MSPARFSVNNSVLVNMLMAVLLIAGSGFAFTLVREMFPESRPDAIIVTAVYPATQPEELEKAVTIKIEEACRDIEGIEKIDSQISEGMSVTTLTLFNEVKDVDAVLQEVDMEIKAIDNMPVDLERLTARKAEPTLPVISVAIYGDGSEKELKQAARDLRDELLLLPGVSEIQLSGTREDEISVEIDPETLRKFDLTLNEVAEAIRKTNLDVSSGNLKGDAANVSVRVLGEESRGVDLEDIEVFATTSGQRILLGDIATIRDEFVETDIDNYFNGKRSANLIIQKTKSQDAIQIATIIKAYIAGKKGEPFDAWGFNDAYAQPWYWKPFALAGVWTNKIVAAVAGRPDPQVVYEKSLATPFPHKFNLALYSDLSRFVTGRLDLMIRNGQSGLILVLLVLNLFLNWRVAFWVAMGLPVSFMGTFILMSLFGVTINLLSMFGLIIVLGIIVDDAIVIGENIYTSVENGMPAREAAIRATDGVMWPVIVSVSTTIGAFLPLLFITGRIGTFFRELPLVVTAALTVSLLEALFILPAHLSHLPKVKHYDETNRPKGVAGFFHRVGLFQTWMMERTLLRPYEWLLLISLRWRYVTVAIAMCTLCLSFGLVAAGIVKFEFIQKMDSETVLMELEMPVGTVIDETRQRLIAISEKVMEQPEVVSVQMQAGFQVNIGGTGAVGSDVQPHLGQLIIELKESDKREAEGLKSSEALLSDMRKFSATIPGVNSVVWEAFSGGPAGKDIEMRISGKDFDEVVEVSTRIKQELNQYQGVVDLEDNFDLGKQEARLTLLESARPTGITVSDLGAFVRNALYGAEARRVTRNREDVKIMVRLPEEYRKDVFQLEELWVPRPSLAMTDQAISADSEMAKIRSQLRWIPISEVAHIEEKLGFTTIHRSAQERSVTVRGDVDSTLGNLNEVMTKFRESALADIQREHPNVRFEFLGTSEEQAKSFAGLTLAFPVAFLIIYMMIAGLFRSYFQPLVVMLAIPFGIQGAIIGHWITGNPATILSLIGLVALSGIVVNDSLVLVDFINELRRQGKNVFEASVLGARSRLRAILLTSLTTIAGLAPLMMEKSFQAKFLIPMAVTLTFGLAFATVLTLILIPCLNMILDDLIGLFRSFYRFLVGTTPNDNEDQHFSEPERVAVHS